MAKVRLHPLFKELRGKVKGLVFRLAHNGNLSAYMSPDMSGVKWSAAQEAHRERFAEASAYAKAAIADPELRSVYVQMSLATKNNKRPYDVALSEYYKGNNLLGERFRWDPELWRARKHLKRRKRR